MTYPKRRAFTIEEDKLMVRQSHGEFSMHQLERSVKASRETLIVRMAELGVQPKIQVQRLRGTRDQRRAMHEPGPADAANACPSVGGDKLLRLLQENYGNRYYEVVDFEAIKKKR
jgi:hypothetical protein